MEERPIDRVLQTLLYELRVLKLGMPPRYEIVGFTSGPSNGWLAGWLTVSMPQSSSSQSHSQLTSLTSCLFSVCFCCCCSWIVYSEILFLSFQASQKPEIEWNSLQWVINRIEIEWNRKKNFTIAWRRERERARSALLSLTL